MELPRLIERIAAGRTDLVVDLVASGAAPATADAHGTSLLQWCAYYGDVSAIRFLLGRGESLATLGPDLGLNGAAFHGHWARSPGGRTASRGCVRCKLSTSHARP